MIKVSVIIPAYNISGYIENTIKSVLQQSKKAHEIIVVDDCSTDNTAAIVHRRKDIVKLVKHSQNRGVSATRNTGADNATGNWYLFLDGDDVLEKNAIESLSDVAETNQGGVVFGRVVQAGKDGKLLQRGNVACAGTPPIPAKHNFWRSSIPTPGCAIISKEQHEAISGFEKPWQPTEDRDYWMKLGMTTPFVLCDQTVLRKTYREESSRTNSGRAIYWGLLVQLDFIKWCHARLYNTDFLNTSSRQIFNRAIQRAFSKREWRVLFTILQFALTKQPKK